MHATFLSLKRLSFNKDNHLTTFLNEEKQLGHKNLNSYAYDSLSQGKGKKNLSLKLTTF